MNLSSFYRLVLLRRRPSVPTRDEIRRDFQRAIRPLLLALAVAAGRPFTSNWNGVLRTFQRQLQRG